MIHHGICEKRLFVFVCLLEWLEAKKRRASEEKRKKKKRGDIATQLSKKPFLTASKYGRSCDAFVVVVPDTFLSYFNRIGPFEALFDAFQ